jgi:hypothetical protein
MASVTLAESAKLTQNLLIAGIIETIVTVNPIYDIFPFAGIDGNALSYNRENVAGDVQFLGVGGTITAKAAATFTNKTSSLTRIIGDAEVDNLIQATRSDSGNDQKAIQIASKAKSIGRQYQDTMINGDGTADSFSGLLSLIPAGQKIIAAVNGAALTFGMFDELLDKVKDKDGQVDFIMLPSRTLRAYYALLRALGGAGIGDVVTLPGGRQVPGYRGTPLFRNDFIPVNQVEGTSGAVCTSIIAGNFDDGSYKYGISGITAKNNAGINVKDLGDSQTKDESVTRVKMYCGMALFSELGVAMVTGVNN